MRKHPRWLVLWLCLLLPFLLLACAGDGEVEPTPAPPPPLFVTVQDALSGHVLPGAHCQLQATAPITVGTPAPTQVRPVQSDAQGQCRFETWPSGGLLQVTAAGYQADDLDLPLEEQVSPGVSPVQLALALWPDRAAGVVLDGYTAAPIGEAEVAAAWETVRTDPSGRFSLTHPTFPFDLQVQAAGYESWTGSFATTTLEISLRPNTLAGTVQDLYTEQPIAGAALTLTGSGTWTATTDAAGNYRFEQVPEAFTLQAQAQAYSSTVVSLERTTRHELRLRPTFLQGQVRDSRDGRPLALARVVWDGSYVHTDEQGQFYLQDVPDPLVLQVLSPGFAKQTLTVTRSTSVTVELLPFEVRGIYVTSFVASTYRPENPDWFGSLLDFVEQTELNAMVIEVKDAFGAVTYDSQLPLPQELDTISARYDVEEILRLCHERDIYTIAYLVTFEDSRLAQARPEWGIQSVSRGGLWQDRKGLNWTDPYIREVWEYNIAIARELAELGFDEIQFDYIRFPTDGSISDIVYAQETDVDKQYATIAAFLERAYEELAPTGTMISADVFGYAAWRKMWEQGQDLSLMTHFLDYICPMSYPSHYSRGELGCANPNECPYEIVLETVLRAYSQMEGGQRAEVRPWLQDFDLGSPPYGPAQVEAQIRATRDAGGAGWCLWNAGNVYTDWVDYTPGEE